METIKVNEEDFKQLVADVAMIKSFLLCPCPDSEGELTDWAKNEIEEARQIPDSENISLEEMEQRIL